MSGFPKAVASSVISLSGSTTITGAGTFLCDASGGAFTVTLPSPEGLTGYSIVLRKIDSTANVVTVAGSIDGANVPGLLSVPGDALDLISDGTTWHVISAVQGPLTFTTSKNWTVPAGWHFFGAQCIFGGGGGGGGGSTSTNTVNQAGGTGGCAGPTFILESWPATAGDTLGVTVGAGGTGGTGGAAGGNAGTNGEGGGSTYLTLNGTQLTSSPGSSGWGLPGFGSQASNAANEGGIFDTDFYGANSYTAIAGESLAPGSAGTSYSSYPIPWGPGAGAGGWPATSTLGGAGGQANTTQTWATQQQGPNPSSGNSTTADGVDGMTAITPGCGGGGGGGGAVGGAGGNGGAGGPGQVTIWRIS